MNDTELSKFQFESAQARLERIIVRLWKLCVLLVILLVLSNGAWIYYESQFEVEEQTTVRQEVDCKTGNAAIYDGVHIGESCSNHYHN